MTVFRVIERGSAVVLWLTLLTFAGWLVLVWRMGERSIAEGVPMRSGWGRFMR